MCQKRFEICDGRIVFDTIYKLLHFWVSCRNTSCVTCHLLSSFLHCWRVACVWKIPATCAFLLGYEDGNESDRLVEHRSRHVDIIRVEEAHSVMPVGDGRDDYVAISALALARVIESLNVIRSFVEWSDDSCEMLRMISGLEIMILGASNCRTKQSRINDGV